MLYHTTILFRKGVKFPFKQVAYYQCAIAPAFFARYRTDHASPCHSRCCWQRSGAASGLGGQFLILERQASESLTGTVRRCFYCTIVCIAVRQWGPTLQLLIPHASSCDTRYVTVWLLTRAARTRLFARA